MSSVPGTMDLCWLVMAILNFGSRRVRPLRIFFVYRSSTKPGRKNEHEPNSAASRQFHALNFRARTAWGINDPCRNMVSRRTGIKRRGEPRPRSARALGTLSIDVKRANLALDDLRTDDDLFDAIEARQFKHRV